MYGILGGVAFKFDECVTLWATCLAILANFPNLGALARPTQFHDSPTGYSDSTVG